MPLTIFSRFLSATPVQLAMLCRYPILAAAFQFFLPIVIALLLKDYVNLYDIRMGGSDAINVLSALAGWAALETAQVHCGRAALDFKLETPELLRKFFDSPPWKGLAIFILALPGLCMTFRESQVHAAGWIVSPQFAKELLIAVVEGGLSIGILVYVGEVRCGYRPPFWDVIIAMWERLRNSKSSRHQFGDSQHRLFALLVGLGTFYIINFAIPFFKPDSYGMTSIGYILLLSTALSLLLSLVSYLLDPSRVPTLAALLLAMVFFNSFGLGDHRFDLAPLPADPAARAPLAPDEAVNGWLSKTTGEPVLVVVTAAGGGIQAAAWTARVLSGLPEVFGERIIPSVRLISTVSGGGVGALFFVDRFSGAVPPAYQELRPRLLHIALNSAQAAAWGMACPDLLRTVFPFIPIKADRAWALEQVWRQSLRDGASTVLKTASDVRAGIRPALAFGTTVSETGVSSIVSPLRIDPKTDFLSLENGGRSADLLLTTGARLSATFPFVTPIAGPVGVESPRHFADGGYVDNFGVEAAVKWVDAVLSAGEAGRLVKPVSRIVFLEIRLKGEPSADAPGFLERYGRGFLGPLRTLIRVRDGSQYPRGLRDLDWLKLRHPRAQFRTHGFYLDEKVPLSWKMNEKEWARMEGTWDGRVARWKNAPSNDADRNLQSLKKWFE